MAKPVWTLLEHHDRWHVACVTGDDVRLLALDVEASETPVALSRRLAAALKGDGFRGGEIVLGLDSARCLVGAIPRDASVSVSDRTGLLYALESRLPASVEQFVADFIITDAHVMGIGTSVPDLLPLIEALQLDGINVRSVVPTVWLAVEAAALKADSLRTEASGDTLFLWEDEDDCHLFVGRPPQWRRWTKLVCDPEDVVREVIAIRLEAVGAPRLVCRGVSDRLMTALQHGGFVATRLDESTSLLDEAARGARDLSVGTRGPTIDLRRDALASPQPYRAIRGLMQATAWAALIALATILGVCELRIATLQSRAADAQVEQEKLFRELFPKSKIPVGVRTRFKSELAKLSGLRGDEATMPVLASAVETLADVMASLPESVRFRVAGLSVDGRRVRLQCEAQSHRDATTMTAALAARGFDVKPAATSQNATGGVSFNLEAERKETEPPPPTRSVSKDERSTSRNANEQPPPNSPLAPALQGAGSKVRDSSNGAKPTGKGGKS